MTRLYCNLVAAGEQAGILDYLARSPRHLQGKDPIAIKSKIKSALFYPISVIVVAFVITAVIMIFVIPAFKDVFKSFGADLPAPTLCCYSHLGLFRCLLVGHFWHHRRYACTASLKAGNVRKKYKWPWTGCCCACPVFGDIVRKSVIARWTRTLATMFAAGVPLVESLDSVGGAAGNYVYKAATKQIQSEVSTGTSLTNAMQNANIFPNMVTQMVAIGEESGALDSMLSKVADFFEQEVDDAVEAMSSLMEPMIMVVLGTLIGGMVVAMYLPIFKLGSVV